MKKSLKARLTFSIVLPVMLTLMALGGVGFYAAYNEAQAIYDTELSHVANLMLSLLRAEDEEESRHGHAPNDKKAVPNIVDDVAELGSDFENTGQRRERKLAFRIWRNDKLLFYSRKSADFGDRRVTGGFFTEVLHDQLWRVYVLPDTASGYTFEVAQEAEVRSLLIEKVLTAVFAPLFLLVPLILVITGTGLRIGLRPLRTVSDAVTRRSASDLTPLSLGASPVEIAPLIDSINGLLAKLDDALQKERRFTDFAAHELRTPIAIFKTQAQTALKASDAAERKTILEAQVQAANRAASMVDQLLTLARLDHTDIPTATLSLNALAQTLVQERLPMAAQRNIDLRFDSKADLSVYANHHLLMIALANLIDNAIKYTPAQGIITVSVTAQDRAAVFAVVDSGPGIPEDKLPFVTERFYRVANHQQAGAGLGLAIVKRAAFIMGATLLLRNGIDRHGFEALLSMPSV